MELAQNDVKWDAFLNAMIAGAAALKPAPVAELGYPIGVAPVAQDSGGGMMDMMGMMGGGGGGGGGGAGSMGGGVGFAADGGNFPAGQPLVVGERGPELMVPQQPVTVVPNQQPAGQDVQGMIRQFLASQLAQQQPQKEKPAGGFNWWYLMPGAAKGAAKLQQMETAKEEIALRRAQLAGQQATQKLSQLSFLQKMEREQAMQQLGPLAGALHTADDPAQIAQLERQMIEILAKTGEPEKIEKFQEARLKAKTLKAIAGMQTPDAGSISETSPGSPGMGQSGETAPQVPGNAAMMYDRLALVGLEREFQASEQRVRGLARFVSVPEGKAAYDAARARSNDLTGRIDTLRKRLAFGGTAIEQVSQPPTPTAYLTPEQMRAGGAELEARSIRRAGAVGNEAAARAAEAEIRKAELAAAADIRKSELGVEAEKIKDQSRMGTDLDKKRLIKLQEDAEVAMKTLETINEAERLIAEGVYGTDKKDLFIMEMYTRKVGYQDDPKAARTARLRELGAVFKLAQGSLGGNVSNTDAVTYGRAAGNFEQAKSHTEMAETLKSMKSILRGHMAYADYARALYRTSGRVPSFSEMPQGGTAPSGGTVTHPGFTRPVGDLTPAERDAEEQLLEEFIKKSKGKR